jgi:YidC/Oxa1 family membrane protein insertase
VVLFDRSRDRLYLARSGLATVDGVAYPNHETVMSAVPGPRELQAGADALDLKLESPPVNGVVLRKTYTLKRGDYRIGVKHEIVGFDQPKASLTVKTSRVVPPGFGTMHIILAVTDHGTPRLTRYQRVIVDVKP